MPQLLVDVERHEFRRVLCSFEQPRDRQVRAADRAQRVEGILRAVGIGAPARPAGIAWKTSGEPTLRAQVVNICREIAPGMVGSGRTRPMAVSRLSRDDRLKREALRTACVRFA